MSYFSQPKTAVRNVQPSATAHSPSSSQINISTFALDVQITGQIVSAGAIEVYGRVEGNIEASQVAVGAGAVVVGDIVAQESLIEGHFKGTIRANSVRLSGTAVVTGEIVNRSLSIEQGAVFEGTSRRLDNAIKEPDVTLQPQPERREGAAEIASRPSDPTPRDVALA